MKKRYARILAATLSAAMVFTSAPVNFTGINTGVIEAQAAKLDVPTPATPEASVTKTFQAGKVTTAAYATIPEGTEKLSYVAVGTDEVTSAGVSSKTVTIYAVIKASDVKSEEVDGYYQTTDLTGASWEVATDATITAIGNYYKSAGTQTVNVIPQGTQTALDALFPTELKAEYGTTDISAATVTGWPETKSASDYNISGDQDLKDLTIGKSLTVTLELKTTPTDTDWSGLTGYNSETGKISKSVIVKCVQATDASSIDVSTSEIAGLAIIAQYGTGNVKLYTTYSDERATNNVESKKWTVKSVKDAIKTTDAGNTVAVEIQTVQSFDDSKYDMVKYCKDTLGAGYSFDTDTKKIVYKTTVDVVPALVDPDSIIWPTTATKVTVGDNYADIKLPKYGSEKYGEYKLSDGSFGAISDPTNASIGDKAVDIMFVLDDNYEFSGESKYAKLAVSGGFGKVEYANGFKVDVQKKIVTEKEVAPQLTVKKLPYGATVADVKAALAANAYVEYSPVDSSSKKLVPGKQTVKFTAKIKNALFASTSFAGNNDEITVSLEVEVVTPAIAVQLVNTDGTTPAISEGVAIDGSKTLKVAIAEGKDGDDYVKNNAQIKSCQWYVVENGKATALPEETTATLVVTPKVAATRQYYCDVVLEAKDNANKADTAALLSTTPVSTNKVTVYSSRFAFAETCGGDHTATFKTGVEFENLTATLSHSGFDVVAQEGFFTDADGKVTATSVAITPGTPDTFTITVPKTLEAGKYEFTIKATLEKTLLAPGEEDETVTAYFVDSYEVTKATLTLADLNAKKKATLDAKFDKDSYVYGTKTSDIVVTSDTTLGTIKIADSVPEYLDANNSVDVKLTLTPNAYTEKNYTKASIDAVNANAGLKLATKITKAPLTIKADDLELVVGDAKPVETKLTYSYEGVVAKDEFAKLGATVALTYAPTLTDAMLQTVGTIKEAIRIDATVVSTNYEVKAVRGDIIVTDGKPAPTVKPSTTPTVAPTATPAKVAATANAKAVKSTVTAKVGASKTTQVKMTAAAKAQIKSIKWTTSNKKVAKLPKSVSKKALKVKVKGLKKGKATIKAVVTFKDGSKKTIKFTVKVK